jgi:hypothetical protein
MAATSERTRSNCPSAIPPLFSLTKASDKDSNSTAPVIEMIPARSDPACCFGRNKDIISAWKHVAYLCKNEKFQEIHD